MLLFDSNVHPTLSGNWERGPLQPSFDNLAKDLASDDIIGACAVGLWNVGAYNHETFIAKCHLNQKLIPIAAFSPRQSANISDELSYIKQLGYKGIKIHPHSCNSDLIKHQSAFLDTFLNAQRLDLVVMLCTHFGGAVSQMPDTDPFWSLVKILKEAPNTRLILVHGGVTRLLQFSELARSNPNILLDLSYTVLKYRQSSLEKDFSYLFNNLDQRLCVGTDYPEYKPQHLKERLSELTQGLAPGKSENICFKNILRFFKLELARFGRSDE